MSASFKMISLPGLFFCFVLLRTCLGAEQSATSAEAVDAPLKCPGNCVEEHACTTVLNETDCEGHHVCCVDHFEKITTEFPDWQFTTLDSLSVSSTTQEEYREVVENDDPNTEVFAYSEDGAAETDPDVAYVYSEESEELNLEPDVERSSMEVEEGVEGGCPGYCVPHDYREHCEYIVDSDIVCPSGSTCCLTEERVQDTRYSYDVEEEEQSGAHVKRDVDQRSESNCPGTCVHPSHALFCEEVLHQFSCPLNAKCCIKRSAERAFPKSTVMECTGQCLPVNMQGYCFPPSELILGSTTCTLGTTCCMRRPLGGPMRPPSVNRMQFPAASQAISGPEASQVVLGHLAVDEVGTVYKVGTNGQIFPLPRLTQRDHLRANFRRLTAYPRSDGEIVIFSDPTGGLYQQFYPRRLTHLRDPGNPLVRQPIYQFVSGTGQEAASQEETSSPFSARQKTTSEVSKDEEALEDVVIPDEEDEAPVVGMNAPVVYDGKTSPPCPGSCMSYFLRFTCFRGYAIYDGFTCPGRSVCCARMKDIEDHEEHLKALSPYFNKPSTSREKMMHRCGIKGRRDTPRVIGGKDSLPGEWCWQVAIINVQNQYICGGALIDNSWVLTAAHCVVGPMKDNQAVFVRAGVTDLKSTGDNDKAQTVRVLSTFIHHNFNSINLDNNIALLRLQKPLDLDNGVCVICLPTSGKMPQASTKCTVTGYGFVSTDGDMSLKISEAQVPIIDDTDCMANVTEALTNPFILPSSSFCAGGQGQSDACQGDAGGPLACDINGFHELVGLVSWGLGCGRNDVPSIYIKVPAFMGWINQIISSSSFLMSLS